MLLYNLHHYRVLSKCVVDSCLARETSSDVSPTCSLFHRLMMSWGHVEFSLLVTGPLVYSSSISSLSWFTIVKRQELRTIILQDEL
jgi:hypothetical protein